MFRCFALLCVSLKFAIAGSAQGFGDASLLSEWHFHLGEVKYGESASLDHSEWDEVRVPHDWTVKQVASPTLASATGYLPGGVAWYRRSLDIPASESDRRHFLYFEGVYNNSEVFVNGNWVGVRPNGYVSFMYDISEHVEAGGDNVVAVRVDHSKDADSRWYTGSGIYRPAYLVSSAMTHIDQWGVSYGAEIDDSGDAELSVSAKVRNHLPSDESVEVLFELRDPDGEMVGTSRMNLSVEAKDTNVAEKQIQVEDARLWNLESAEMYTLTTVVSKDGTELDRSDVNVGIRKIEFDANKGFALNGEWMNIKGVCLHHDAGTLGAAVPKEVWIERVTKLKEIGVNGIRMSHNPHSPDLYEVCDELGVLVMDEGFDEWEYPKKKWLEGWNVGVPGFQGTSEFFREWGPRDIESLVLRDRNHPSVIMWSIGNEVDYPNDPYSHEVLDEEGIGQIHRSGYQPGQPHADRLGGIAKELAAIVREHDETRPVTAALAGVVMSNETEYPGALDIVGYNYTEYRYERDHEAYPERIIYGSETRHDLNAWKAVRDNDYIFGQFIWTGFDYLGEAGRWPSRGFTTGMINQANQIKGRGYFRKALWTEDPMVYVGASPVTTRRRGPSMDAPKLWNWEEGQMMYVVAYTNCDEAELYLDGEKVGNKKPYDDDTAIIEWEIPFKAGELKVLAYKDGKVVAEDKVVTASAPVKIVATASQAEIDTEGGVALVYLEAHDKEGRISRLADNLVSCQVSEGGRLLGLENGSNNVADDFTGNQLRFIDGKLLAYVESLGTSDTISVSFDSPYLESAVVEIALTR